MRAKMSDRDCGPRQLFEQFADLNLPGIEQAAFEADAEREARAILAETEPEPYGCYSGLPKHLSPYDCISPVWDALTESLAAFLEE